jgi:cell division ATPase FtsA
MATQTQTQVRKEPPYIRINPVMGHAMNIDEDTAENIRRALGSDHADPPDEHQHMTIPHWQFQVPGNAG